MRVEVLPRPESTLAAVVLAFRGAGTATDGEPEGVAPLTATLMLEGTRIADGSVLGGLTINGHAPGIRTFPDGSVLKLESLSSLVVPGIDLLSQIVRGPAFEPTSFSRALNRQLNAIAGGSMTWNQHLLESALEELHGTDPVARSDLGRSGPVAHLTNDDVRRFYARRYRPESSALIVGGDVDPETVFALAESRFGNWRALLPVPPQAARRPLARNENRRVVAIDQPTLQAKILFVAEGPPPDHEDSAGFSLAVSILGGHAASRAFESLRLHDAQAYAVLARIEHQARASHMQLYFGVANADIVSATTTLFRESERLASTLPSEVELSRAKSHARSTTSFRLGGSSGFVDERALAFLSAPSDATVPPLRDRIERASARDVQRAAARWLHPDRLQLAIVANRAAAEVPLRALGSVRWYTLASTTKDPEHF
jgi:zinc protease